MKKTLVIALGGNALIRKGQEGTIKEQFANTNEALKDILPLIAAGHRIVITHGNGPVVGFLMLRIEAGEKYAHVPYSPLGIAVADSQGGIGYIIKNSLDNLLFLNKIDRKAVTLLTQVLVDKDDPSFQNPTKPIGPFYSKEEADALSTKKDWVLKEDAGRGYRRVVPSPFPLKIIETEAILKLLKDNFIVIAAGGGGIPVIYREDKTLKGVPAVIDKDLASAVLATEIKADTLLILTAVEKVLLHHHTPQEKALDTLTVKEAQKYLKEGHFPPGSMGPKIEAAVHFLTHGGKEVIIGSIEKAKDAFEGRSGTRIIP